MNGALSLPSSGAGGGFLTVFFQKAVRHPSHETPVLSAAETLLEQAVDDASALVGGAMLGATSIDDLDARMGEVIERRELAAALNKVFEASGVMNLGSTDVRPAAGDLNFLLDVLGEGQTARLREAEQLIGVLYESHLAVINLAEQLALTGVAFSLPERPWNENDPVSFLSDASIPPRVGELLLGGVVAQVSFMAIRHARTTKMRVDPWLALALMERCVAGLRKSAILVASLPFVQIDPRIVPLDQRIDIARVEREHDEARLALQEFLRAADESGEDIYVPEPHE